jgi:hypothetical protein
MANGLYTNDELIDSLILDLNNLPKNLIDGQFIHFCDIVSQMGQKLINLKKGITNDLAGKDRIIEQLKEQLKNTGAEFEEMTPEEFVKKSGKKDGAE